MSASLSAATQDRKARLAALKSLKRKQPTADDDASPTDADNEPSTHQPPAKSPRRSASPTQTPPSYLSGRNYDSQTRGPKLGFESAPTASAETLEKRAAELAEQTRLQALKEQEEDKPLDLFKLQPKKPNWDLKRDLDRKLEVLNVRTENAIAKLVRERVAGAQGKAKDKAVNGGAKGDGEEVGMEGVTLVEATKEREREDEEDAKRERELDEELLDGS